MQYQREFLSRLAKSLPLGLGRELLSEFFELKCFPLACTAFTVFPRTAVHDYPCTLTLRAGSIAFGVCRQSSTTKKMETAGSATDPLSMRLLTTISPCSG